MKEPKSEPTPPATAGKPVIYMRSSQKDLRDFPSDVQEVVAQALHEAAMGLKPFTAKPLKGDPKFKGAKTLEIVEDDDGNTYRAVYTVKFAGYVYVLHAFQKKSKSGIATPLTEVRKIKSRLADAEAHYNANFRKRKAS